MVKKEMFHFTGMAIIHTTEKRTLWLHLLKLSCDDGNRTRILAINNREPISKYSIFPFGEINENNVRLWYIQNYNLVSDYVFILPNWKLEEMGSADSLICNFNDDIKTFIKGHIDEFESNTSL